MSRKLSGYWLGAAIAVLYGAHWVGSAAWADSSAPAAGPAKVTSKVAGALPRDGFSCCNLHYEKDWISDGNYAGLPMLPAGTPMRLISYGRHKAAVEVAGKKMRLGHDYGRDQESLQQWASKIVIETDPSARIASYPADVRAAIKDGQVMVGMTREQAIVALGYPLTSENPSLDGPVWRHWVSSFEEFQLIWGPDGRIAQITAVSSILPRVIHPVGK